MPSNRNLVSEPVGGGVRSKFDQWVTEDPTKYAIVYEDEQLTYSELDHRSRQLASNLTRHGVSLEDIVAFCFPKSVHAVIAILAILRCGAAFTALPPDAPKVRKNDILSVCKPKAVLCGEEQKGILGGLNVPILPVGNQTYRQHVPAVEFPIISNNNAACVLFTSGSTGSTSLLPPNPSTLILTKTLPRTKRRCLRARQHPLCIRNLGSACRHRTYFAHPTMVLIHFRYSHISPYLR